MPRNINQVSEASNPEEVVQYALQKQDRSAATQSRVVDAQLSTESIPLDDPLLPTGLFPLADLRAFPNQNQENIAGTVISGSNSRTTFTATPDHRKGPNSPGADSPYPLPAANVSTPIRPGRDAFIANQVNNGGPSGQVKGSGLGVAPEKGNAPASIPIKSDTNANYSIWKHVQGGLFQSSIGSLMASLNADNSAEPPVLYIRLQDDRNNIPNFFGIDGTRENNSVQPAEAEPGLLTPFTDNEKYEIDPSYQMFATTTIPQDEVILHERCLVILEESNIFGQRDMRLADVQYTFQNAPPEAKRYLEALHPPTGGFRVMTETNHFTRHPNGHMVRRYYHKISNVRHCCHPNAQMTLLDDQSVILRAIRKIKKGDEVTVAYLEMDNEKTEPKMREIYNIHCSRRCVRCTTPATTIGQLQGQTDNTHRISEPAPVSQPGAPIPLQDYRLSNADTMKGSDQSQDNDSQKNMAVRGSFPNNSNPPANHGIPTPPQSVPPNDHRGDSCCSCGLGGSMKEWLSTLREKVSRVRGKVSEFCQRMSIKRHVVPRDSSAGGNQIPDAAVLTDAFRNLRSAPADDLTPTR
ncbi:hypothetical protein HYFRA_00012696 [Hymenoscyphus fraxineus]|uniref:SET domain-containing protein n=1 Tax=Hymenoscyphus fraxineus TaxID=746836 RepID=A0A9N9L6F6_9HELO|nr:hypothetical protein HYFRA_00012696 [Hymenoscyphus fraxineus]